MASSRTGTLVVERARGRGREDEFFYVAKWRASRDGRQMKRRLGPAWLAVDGDGKPHLRRGRIKPDFLDERRAYGRMAEVIAQCEDEDARREEIDAARQRSGWTFGALAEAWLDHAERVRRLKPSTMRDLRSILARPGVSRRRGGGAVKARLMTMLGDVPAASIVVDDIEDYFRLLADDGVSPRTVNRHREVLRAIFNYGCQASSGFQLEGNPAAQTDLRRQDGPRPLEVFSVEQVEHLARSAADGSWRAAIDWTRAEETVAQMRREDAQLGELLRIACYCGLRRGELVLLRWDDVHWSDRVLIVGRALSDGVEVLPKSGRARYVPLADQALAASSASRAAATSRKETTTSSSTRSVTDSTPQRCAAATSASATPPVCRRCASTTAPHRRLSAGPPHGPRERQGHPRPRRPGHDRALPARTARVAACGCRDARVHGCDAGRSAGAAGRGAQAAWSGGTARAPRACGWLRGAEGRRAP